MGRRGQVEKRKLGAGRGGSAKCRYYVTVNYKDLEVARKRAKEKKYKDKFYCIRGSFKKL